MTYVRITPTITIDKNNQKCRIDQRIQKSLSHRHHRLLVVDVTVDDIHQIAAALTGKNRRRVDRRENTLGSQRFRKHRAGMHAIPNIDDVTLQNRILDLRLQKIQRPKDRKTRLDQRRKLLIEDDEIFGLDADFGDRACPETATIPSAAPISAAAPAPANGGALLPASGRPMWCCTISPLGLAYLQSNSIRRLLPILL